MVLREWYVQPVKPFTKVLANCFYGFSFCLKPYYLPELRIFCIRALTITLIILGLLFNTCVTVLRTGGYWHKRYPRTKLLDHWTVVYSR